MRGRWAVVGLALLFACSKKLDLKPMGHKAGLQDTVVFNLEATLGGKPLAEGQTGELTALGEKGILGAHGNYIFIPAAKLKGPQVIHMEGTVEGAKGEVDFPYDPPKELKATVSADGKNFQCEGHSIGTALQEKDGKFSVYLPDDIAKAEVLGKPLTGKGYVAVAVDPDLSKAGLDPVATPIPLTLTYSDGSACTGTLTAQVPVQAALFAALSKIEAGPVKFGAEPDAPPAHHTAFYVSNQKVEFLGAKPKTNHEVDVVALVKWHPARRTSCGTYVNKAGDTKQMERSELDADFLVFDRLKGTQLGKKLFTAPTAVCDAKAGTNLLFVTTANHADMHAFAQTFLK